MWNVNVLCIIYHQTSTCIMHLIIVQWNLIFKNPASIEIFTINSVYMGKSTSIYIHTSIYSDPQTDCFVVSQFFCVARLYLPNPSAKAGYDTRSIFKWSLTGLNSEFSFSKAEEPSLSYYLSIARGRIIGFILLPRVLALCEMLSVSSRIWTRVAVSIFYDDNHYTTGTIGVARSSKSFALWERQPKIPSLECSTPMGERIYCHPQTDYFSVARRVGRLKPNFTLDLVSDRTANNRTTSAREL